MLAERRGKNGAGAGRKQTKRGKKEKKGMRVREERGMSEKGRNGAGTGNGEREKKARLLWRSRALFLSC